jgi:predicted RNase H-like nuclease
VDVRVAGVDGCRGGWLVVTAVASPFVVVGCEVAAGIAVVLERGDLAMVAVDMPIGLPFDESARMADVEARRRLGPRRSSVFPTPARAVLHARSFEDALVRSCDDRAGVVDPGVEPGAEDRRARRCDDGRAPGSRA